MEALQKLGIDGWGIVLYLVNFGVLLIILQKFVFKPLLEFIDKRREEIATNVHAAEAMKLTLELDRAKEEAARHAREILIEDRIRSAKLLAKDEAKSTLKEAESQKEAILVQARQIANETVQGALSEAQDLMLKRIETVVTEVLQDVATEEVVQESIKKSWKKLANKM